MVAEDYFAAAFRHADDSDRLLAQGRSDNAAYLAGYVFECGLKVLIDSSRHYSSPPLRVHDLLTLETLALAATLTEADAEHTFPQKAITAARASGWAVGWRYVPDGTVAPTDAATLVAAASAMREALVAGVMDGRVSR